MKYEGKQPFREADFVYPGPKPQSREAGILMLADLVEATARTMEDMTAEQFEETIEGLIRRRFIEGQLDECDLTLRDLNRIREAFLKILIGMHHQRIKYPEPEPSEPRLDPAGTSESATPAGETLVVDNNRTQRDVEQAHLSSQSQETRSIQ